MKTFIRCLVLLPPALLFTVRADAQDDASLEDNTCVACHTNTDLWEEDTLHLLVKLEDMARDVHWQKGIRCQDCHGGDAEAFETREAHAAENGFRDVASPADLPDFCGHCHSDAERMKGYAGGAEPKPGSTDIVRRFWQSAHGQQLKQFADRQSAAAASEGSESGEAVDGDQAVEAESSETGGVGGEAAGAADVQAAADEQAVVGGAASVDRQAVTCSSCHLPHGMVAASDPLSLSHPARLAEACGVCHAAQRDALLMDVHRLAGAKDAQGAATTLGCGECHGDDVHGMLPVEHFDSPVFLHHQVEACGACHEQDKLSYLHSVHGRGLYESGLVVTAVCADCHGAHGILPADNPDSRLHATHVAATCAACHRFIEDRLKNSVHGGIGGPGGATEQPAPGGEIMRTASCSDCHQGHDLPDPRSPEFRQAMSHRCGDCHSDLLHQYALSVHGALTELGYGPAAKCADCHGDHDIRAVDDPESRVAPANRAATCGKCHPGASGNFLDFDPHADHTDPQRSPLLYAIYLVLLSFILGTFGFFGVHSILWFVRSLVEVLRHGRAHSWTPGAVAYQRFSIFHRAAHTALLVSFLGLALTGLPLKYSQTEWAHATAALLGGFASTSVWHRIFGLVNIGCLAIYLVRMLIRVVAARRRGVPLKQTLFGPDSPLPNWRDVKDFMAMVRWFFGQGTKPTFERWAYWEKFDFWGASADIVIIGFTGLILWFPHAFTAFLPGETLNVAKVIHSTQALLATGFVFAIHFFATHLRPEKFPMDMVILTGMVSEEELREERPDMLARLEREGKLDAMRTTIPPRRRLLALATGGAIGLSVGLLLLIGILVGILGG